MTNPRLDLAENTDDWAYHKEPPPFAAPVQLGLCTVAGILIICGVTLMTQTAHLAGPTQTYISAWCLTTIGIQLITGVVAAENYRRMKSLGRGKARMQKAQLKLRDGQRELTVGQAELKAGQKVIEQLMIELRDQISDGIARLDAGTQAADHAKAEILALLEKVGDRVDSGVDAVEGAYAAAGGLVDEFTPRLAARD